MMLFFVDCYYEGSVHKVVSRLDTSQDFLYACSASSFFRNEYKLGNRVFLQVLKNIQKSWTREKGVEIVNEIVRLSNRGQARDCRTNTSLRSNMWRGRTTSDSEERKSRWLLSRCDNTLSYACQCDKLGTEHIWHTLTICLIIKKNFDSQKSKLKILKTVLKRWMLTMEMVMMMVGDQAVRDLKVLHSSRGKKVRTPHGSRHFR